MDGHYEARINRAIDYINARYAEKITLEMLAQESGVSPWHFHRVFLESTGETTNEYITRVRLEKARLLMFRGLPITEIALRTGFSSSSHFSMAFKKTYRCSPTRFLKNRKKTQYARDVSYSITDFPGYKIAYVRHVGAYDVKIGLAWAVLRTWARKHGLTRDNSMTISCSWDSPEITEEGKLRYDVCMSLPRDFIVAHSPRNPVSFREIPGGPHAVFPFIGTTAQLADFYHIVFGDILPKSALLFGETPGYRVHFESPVEQAFGICKQELRVPLQAEPDQQ